MGYICDENAEKKIAKICHDLYDNIVSDGFGIEFEKRPFSIKVWIKDGNQSIAGFTLKEMINCCGALVSTQTYVLSSHQKRGIAQSMMPIKEALAKEFGYSMLMATVNMTDNKAECHILEKFGWTKVDEFKNSRTKHQVGLFTKKL